MISLTNFAVCIANQNISVSCNYAATHKYCAAFQTNATAKHFLAISPADIDFERQKDFREAQLEGLQYNEHSDAYLETIALQRKITEILFDYNILLFHGSVVAVDGTAYLFTAKSGTGKSTHTRLWREQFGDRAVMVNDDKPFLQLTDQGVIAHGSPWNGKHRLGANISVPLKAICILERSAENWIKPISAAKALHMLFQQSQRPQTPANMPKYMELIEKLANSVEFYQMGCNMDPEAALISYEAMSRGRKDDRE